MNYEDKRSKYYYDDTDILINKMDLKDVELLNEYERKVVSLKLLIIDHANFGDKFDKKRLQEIHSFLFSEIYDFAGEFRTENLAKDDFRFASCEFIDQELDRILASLINYKEMEKMSQDEVAEKLAYYMSEINVVHPFREGNGRTYREFIRQLAFAIGYILDWSKCEYKDLYEASLQSVYDTKFLTEIINKCLTKKMQK